jgi:hypothetical protein
MQTEPVMTKIPAVKEAKIEALLRARVEAAGGLCLKITTLGRRGFPDRLVVLPGGRVVFVELKRPRGGKLRVHQIQYFKLLTALQVEACVVRSVQDIDELLNP